MAVVVINHVSLDGVLQGPGRPDEDPRDGFAHGGWATSLSDPASGAADPVIGEAMASVMGGGFAWLFGRRSYDDMLGHWNAVGGPYRDGLNAATKYVVSSHPDAVLPWPHSVLVTGDVPTRIAELRVEHPGNLVVMGSGRLIHSLLPHDLIDELLLLIHPLSLGSGHRLLPDDGELRRFELVSVAPTETGIIAARYRRPQ